MPRPYTKHDWSESYASKTLRGSLVYVSKTVNDNWEAFLNKEIPLYKASGIYGRGIVRDIKLIEITR